MVDRLRKTYLSFEKPQEKLKKVTKKSVWERARLEGKLRFRWNCPHHGEQDYRVSSGGCVKCRSDINKRKHQKFRKANPILAKREFSIPAWKSGLKTFMWECPHHGLTEYLVSSETCILCTKQYRKKNAAYIFARSLISRLNSDKQETFSGITKGEAESLCGYSQVEFILHIESTFKKGMSWDNRSEWHIDHILPVAWFKEQGITDIKVINALNNLRAEWASDNMSKGRNFLEEDLTEEEFLEMIMSEVDDGKDF